MGAEGEARFSSAEPGDQAGSAVSADLFLRAYCVSYIDAQNYRKALSMTEALLKELKQLDDKIILTEVFLLESRAAHAIQNMPRAKVSTCRYVHLRYNIDLFRRR